MQNLTASDIAEIQSAEFPWFLKSTNSKYETQSPFRELTRMKKIITTLSVSLLALFLLFSPTAAAAATSQSFSLAIGGGFNNIAQQQLQMGGGTLQSNSYITVGTTQVPLNTAGSHLTFSLNAQVTGVHPAGHSGYHGSTQPIAAGYSGNSGNGGKGNNNRGWHGDHYQADEIQTSGSATFDLKANSALGSLEIRGFTSLTDMVPALGLPLVPGDTTGLACFDTDSCTSAIPAFYVGNASITVQVSGQHGPTTPVVVPMLFESPYMNPFGGPIVIESADVLLTGVPAIQIIISYTSANSTWSGVNVSGLVIDPTTYSIIGQFNQTASLQESLFKGTETDQGTLVLYGFTGSTYSVLNSNGPFQGTSTIPTANAIDCSSAATPGLPNPFPAGTCTETGSISIGTFNLTSTNPGSHNVQITGKVIGSYIDEWTVPAFAFSGVVQATTSGH